MHSQKQKRTVDFNPRPREEGDRIKIYKKTIAKYFNPRPREEGDKRGFEQIAGKL